MHRVLLLTLLAIPVLVIMHIALFWQPVPWANGTFSAATRNGSQLHGCWQPPEHSTQSRFAIDTTANQGS